jgi:hypothetical protein
VQIEDKSKMDERLPLKLELHRDYSKQRVLRGAKCRTWWSGPFGLDGAHFRAQCAARFFISTT